MMSDYISRQAAIDAVDSETVSTNPEHFKSNEKFIKFMDDSDISSFGKWQWANGFNTALVATRIHLKKLPSAQPDFDEWCTDCSEYDQERHCCPRWNRVIRQTLKDAQPERKKGKWIPHSETCREYIGTVLVRVDYDYWFCDACGYRVKNGQPMYKFCPNCGADMRGEA